MGARIFFGGIVGGLTYFAWTAISWTVLPWHDATIKALPHEEATVASLSVNVPESGVYYFPSMPHGGMTPEQAGAEEHQWQERHRKGPIGLLIMQAGGQEPMPPGVFGKAIAVDILAAFLVALVMAKNTLARGLFGRASCAAIMGLFSGLVSHGANWIWMHHPALYTFTMIADLTIGWTLAGLVIAAIVRRPASTAGAPATIAGVVEPG